MRPQILDIRSIPAERGEPFISIMAAVNGLHPGQELLLTAPFKPEPLLRLLDGKGFDHEANADAEGLWHVRFRPRARIEDLDVSNPLTWPRPSVLVDLTGTEPGPTSQAVLDAIFGVEPRQVLFALLREEPSDLVDRLLAQGHFSFARWQQGTYRIMVLVSGIDTLPE